MWGSSPSTSNSSSSRRGNNKGAAGGAGGGSRRGGGSGLFGAMSPSGSSAINEGKAEKIFEELCDDDNPGAASMEGECWDSRKPG